MVHLPACVRQLLCYLSMLYMLSVQAPSQCLAQMASASMCQHVAGHRHATTCSTILLRPPTPHQRSACKGEVHSFRKASLPLSVR